MEKKSKTPIKVLEMNCGDFLNEFLPKKHSAAYTRARLLFFEKIAWMNFDNWGNVLMKDIIFLLQKEAPEKLLNSLGVGPERIKTLIEAFERSGINLDDLPEYKRWFKQNM